MDTSKIYSSGVLNKGEEITDCFQGKCHISNDMANGLIVFTNRRFIFLRKPPGLFTKGYNVVLFSSWGDIVSVSTTGLISKKLHLSIQKENGIVVHKLSCDKVEDVAQRILRGAISSLHSCIADMFFLKIAFNDTRLLLATS